MHISCLCGAGDQSQGLTCGKSSIAKPQYLVWCSFEMFFKRLTFRSAVWVGTCAYKCRCLRPQNGVPDLLGLELEAIVSHPLWTLRELRSSASSVRS